VVQDLLTGGERVWTPRAPPAYFGLGTGTVTDCSFGAVATTTGLHETGRASGSLSAACSWPSRMSPRMGKTHTENGPASRLAKRFDWPPARTLWWNAPA